MPGGRGWHRMFTEPPPAPVATAATVRATGHDVLLTTEGRDDKNTHGDDRRRSRARRAAGDEPGRSHDPEKRSATAAWRPSRGPGRLQPRGRPGREDQARDLHPVRQHALQ